MPNRSFNPLPGSHKALAVKTLVLTRLGHREPTELRNTFIARPYQRPTFPGTNLLLLGIGIHQRPSGIWVAGSNGSKGTADALKSFITASELVGQEMTLADLHAALESATPLALTRALASLLAPIETSSHLNKAAQRDLAHRILADAPLNRALGLIEEGRVFLAPQPLLVAMKTALVLGNKLGSDDVVPGHLLNLIFFTVHLLSGIDEDELDIPTFLRHTE